LGEYDKALADYNTAAKLAPSIPAVFLQRSVVHARAGSAEKSAADWATACKLDPTLTAESRPVIADPPVPPARKQLNPEETKDLAKALAAFDRTWGTGQVEECRNAAEDACRIDPTSAAARSA